MNEKVRVHELEGAVFEKYRAKLGTELELLRDGLHYRGNFFYRDNCWGREPGNEEEQWKYVCEKRRGLVVITKDLHDTEAWDIREEHGRKNGIDIPKPSKHIFCRRLRYWIYGLININTKGAMPEWPNIDLAQRCFENDPWVRINLKKVLGESSVSPKTMSTYIENFHDLLLEQLKIYKNASIYLDCSRRNGIKLLKEIYSDLKPYGKDDDSWIYFSEQQRFIVVNSYHPSYRRLGGEENYYNRMKDAVQDFFHENPFLLEIRQL